MKAQDRYHKLLAAEAQLQHLICELNGVLSEVSALREEQEKKLTKIREKRRKTGN